MILNDELSQDTIKHICLYFNGDNNDSVYRYRTGSELADMYSIRFKGPSYTTGVSRWYLCAVAMQATAENDNLSEFFNTMLSFRNIKKEKNNLSDEEIANLRKKAIEYINSLLYNDDYELIDVSGTLHIYKIDDEKNLIGIGGFAKVYKIPGTNKVIKKLKEEFKSDHSIVSRFKNEYILITSNLKDIDGIIKAYDYDNNNITYTMEYCDTDLKKYINDSNSNLANEDKYSLILNILEIMSNVHKQHVLHRDLSPKNIFIKNGKPIIADFGLGKAIDSSGRTYVTVDTSYQGTLEYCDPRQFQGLGFANEQSDIYSLGKIINFIMKKDPENFEHTLTIISTIATQSSLSARYKTIDELIEKLKQIIKHDNTNYFSSDFIDMIEQEKYDPKIDEYLLSFNGEDLIVKMYDAKFLSVYLHLFHNNSYEQVLIQKFSAMHERLEDPIGLTFANLDLLGIALINILRDFQISSPALKDMIGKCIYDIACGVGRWAVQNYLGKNFDKIDKIYIQDSLTYLKEKEIIG